jgi:gliding motility-associated-like protein
MSPQIFTPNGDNVNDKFIVEGKFIKNLKMTIYDRWGNPIFHDEQNGYPIQTSQSPNTVIGWDGTMNNGNKALEGSYAFKIEIEDTIGQITVKEGALLLAY